MVRLIGQAATVRRLILGVDVARWCETNGYKQYRRDAVFPEWLYDKSRLDDFSALFNLDMVEWAYEQLKLLLGLDSPAVPANGYRNFLNEKLWTAARAKEKLYGSKGIAVAALDPYESPNLNLPSVPSQIFPDLRLLRQAADSLPATTELIVVIMPSHASSFLNDDKDERDTIEQCKRSIATEITYPRVTVLDFRIPSIWTRNATTFGTATTCGWGSKRASSCASRRRSSVAATPRTGSIAIWQVPVPRPRPRASGQFRID